MLIAPGCNNDIPNNDSGLMGPALKWKDGCVKSFPVEGGTTMFICTNCPELWLIGYRETGKEYRYPTIKGPDGSFDNGWVKGYTSANSLTVIVEPNEGDEREIIVFLEYEDSFANVTVKQRGKS